jgi:hypothetical protein
LGTYQHKEIAMDQPAEPFDTWAIVELLGHRRLAGRCTEETLFGAALLRIDIPTSPDTWETQYYSAAALYGLQPVSEDAARRVAARSQPQPLYAYELPAPRVYAEAAPDDDPDAGEGGDADEEDDGL